MSRQLTEATPYLQDFSICVQHKDSDLDILLHALSSSLKISSLQCQVQVVTDVAWNQKRSFPKSTC